MPAFSFTYQTYYSHTPNLYSEPMHYRQYSKMKLNLAFAFFVAATCLSTNVTSASKSDTVADIEAPAASHLRPHTIESNVDTPLDGLSISAASQVHKMDKKMMEQSDHENMISKTSHLARRDTVADSWIQIADFVGDTNDRLGWGTALAKGGDRYAIGSPGNKDVQVFDWNMLSSLYEQVGTDIVVPDKAPYSVGYTVAMSKDGTHLIAGGGGFVAMFEYSKDDKDWVPLGTNYVIDIGTDASNFGTVDMTEDGKRIAVSNTRANNLVGKVMIYDYICDTSCSWNEVVVLNGIFPGETFGSSLSMSNTGTIIVIGSSHQSSSISEDFVRVFEETPSGWSQVGEDLDVVALASFSGGVSMDGRGKRFSVLTLGNSEGLRVYDITDSGKLELDSVMLPCYSNSAISTTKLSADGDRVVANCNDEVKIYERNTSASALVWEQVGSIPNSWSMALSLSRDGLVVGLGNNFYGDWQGAASIWNSPNHNKNSKCTNSPLKFQVETVGGSLLPFSCKWAAQNEDTFTCSNKGQVATHCPKVCGTCSEYGCSDSEGVFFTKNGKKRECSWLQEMKMSKRINKCKKTPSIAETCRETCNFCE